MNESARDRSLRLVLAKIAESGPSQIEHLKKCLPLSENTIYRVCIKGCEEGYLERREVKTTSGCGRRRTIFTRTAKEYVPATVCEKTVQNRIALQRSRDVEVEIRPFRHWTDSALFGPYPKQFEFEPKIVSGRVYRQPMSLNDEEEEAA